MEVIIRTYSVESPQKIVRLLGKTLAFISAIVAVSTHCVEILLNIEAAWSGKERDV